MFHESRNYPVLKIIGLLVLSFQADVAVSQSATNNQSSLFTPNMVTLSVGPIWEHAGKAQTFYLTPGIEKTYTTNNLTNELVDAELFVGKQWRMHQRCLGQLGFAFATTGNAKLTGDIWDDANPAFDNYNYQYKIEHTHFALKGKLLGDWGYTLLPWISASVGLGLNHANSYTSTPTIFEAAPTPDFASNTQVAFTYTIGAGVQTMLTQNWQIGIGYEFADWGKSRLDRAAGQTLGHGLTLNHLYTNGVLMNVTYNS